MSHDLIRENIDLQAEASSLRQIATALVVELRTTRRDAYGTDHAESADIFDVAASVLDNRRAGQPLLEENKQLSTELALARAVCDQLQQELHDERARVAALREREMWADAVYVRRESDRVMSERTPEQKIALYDALAAHLVATLPSYYTTFDQPPDPRYDSGDAQEAPTSVIEMDITDGYLNIEMGVQGWADAILFSIELPTLTRSDQT